jgi:hypothetical protein
LENFRNIPQIKSVMGFLWSREQVQPNGVVNGNDRIYDGGQYLFYFLVEASQEKVYH